jgi:hypothetical protein
MPQAHLAITRHARVNTRIKTSVAIRPHRCIEYRKSDHHGVILGSRHIVALSESPWVIGIPSFSEYSATRNYSGNGL